MEDRIFCKIISREVKSDIVHENKGAIIIMSNEPETEGHMVVFAKKHFSTLDLADENYWNYIRKILVDLGERLRSKGYDGYNLLSANGKVAGQSVQHFHFHVIPRKEADGIVAWPDFGKKVKHTKSFYKRIKF